jgi:hypothetical protein
MLGSKNLLIIVSLLTFSGFALANQEAARSLADPNTKLSGSTVAPEVEAVETNAVKYEAQLNEAEVDVKPNKAVAVEKVAENKSMAIDAPKPENAQSVAMHPDLQVLEFVLTDNVENREPKNIVDNFNKENKQGYAFARLSSLKQSDVTFIWLRNGKEQTRFTTSVHASKKWRTFSGVKLKTGDWTVRLVSGDKVIAEKTFTIQ